MSLAEDLLPHYPRIDARELHFHLVEGMGRVMPEGTEDTADWVVDSLRRRGARVHLNTRVVSAVEGHVILSTGLEFDSELIVWTAGNGVNPLVSKHTDLPVDDCGYLKARADLRIGTERAPVLDAWTAGDDANIPDLSSTNPGSTRAAPTAQHAVRQGRRVAVNVVLTMRGQQPKPYQHRKPRCRRDDGSRSRGV